MNRCNRCRRTAPPIVLGAATIVAFSAAVAQTRPPSESSPYNVMVALDMSSPYVPDGRMSFAALAFSATFKNVVFRWNPRTGPLVDAPTGRLWLTAREFNEVNDDGDRHRPWVTKPWPKEFEAGLVLADDPVVPLRRPGRTPADDGDIPLVPLVPGSVRLRFMAHFGLTDLQWYSKIGSNALSSMEAEFEVPWQSLMNSRPITVKVPFEGDPEEKGTWWIELLPQPKR